MAIGVNYVELKAEMLTKDKIWRQSFLCGRASHVEQFASSSSSRRQFALF